MKRDLRATALKLGSSASTSSASEKERTQVRPGKRKHLDRSDEKFDNTSAGGPQGIVLLGKIESRLSKGRSAYKPPRWGRQDAEVTLRKKTLLRKGDEEGRFDSEERKMSTITRGKSRGTAAKREKQFL